MARADAPVVRLAGLAALWVACADPPPPPKIPEGITSWNFEPAEDVALRFVLHDSTKPAAFLELVTRKEALLRIALPGSASDWRRWGKRVDRMSRLQEPPRDRR